MSIRKQACIAGAFEHPTRKAPDKTTAQLHAECAKGALDDAGLSLSDVDAYFCASDAPGLGALDMAEYLGLKLRHIDTTEIGGASYVSHVAHAAQAIAMGKCDVALITLAGRPRSFGKGIMDSAPYVSPQTPDLPWETPYGLLPVNMYGLAAARHMHEFGTTSEQLAWVRVAASIHAQFNPHAMLPSPVSVEDVLASPMISDPLHRLDCCVISDGGGGLVVVRPEIARSLKRPVVNVLGASETYKGYLNGQVDLTWTGGALSAPRAFEEARVTPADIQYVSIYDSFTITVVMLLEDLGFCEKGQGGRFVADGNLISGVGKLPFNTDGGGLCNNHPEHRGGITKVIEAVRQLRGEAAAQVQVPDCKLALAQGMGGMAGGRHASSTLILERD